MNEWKPSKPVFLPPLPHYDPDKKPLCDSCKWNQENTGERCTALVNTGKWIVQSPDGVDNVFRLTTGVQIVFRRYPERPEYQVAICRWYQVSRKASYREYMNSPAWKEKRRQKFREADWKCERCGSAVNLSVHHVSYNHLKDEPMDDLVVLCRDCHAAIHGKERKHDCMV